MIKKFRNYFFVTLCFFLIIALIFFSLYVRENVGIQSIRFYNQGDKVRLKIRYVDCMGYSVETLKNNETIMKGERAVNCSNLIGENAIKITLYETKISDKLKENYEYFEVYIVNLEVPEIKGNIDVKFMLCPSPEHSLKIYAGFDNFLKVRTNEYMKINWPLGVIDLELARGTQGDGSIVLTNEAV